MSEILNNQATYIFRGELNDFLSKKFKYKEVNYQFEGNSTVKDSIESIGTPHAEVAFILANNRPVDFNYKVQNNDFIEVFPFGYENNISDKYKLPEKPKGKPAFILDVHLGILAKYLRMSGFDTLYNPKDWGDEYIAKKAGEENRIALSRDIGLLKRSAVVYGRWLRNQNSKKQLEEVIKRFDLKKYFEPFTRCMKCNNLIVSVDKEKIADKLEEQTKKDYNNFWECSGCKQIYWKGSHYDKMMKFVEEISE